MHIAVISHSPHYSGSCSHIVCATAHTAWVEGFIQVKGYSHVFFFWGAGGAFSVLRQIWMLHSVFRGLFIQHVSVCVGCIRSRRLTRRGRLLAIGGWRLRVAPLWVAYWFQ